MKNIYYINPGDVFWATSDLGWVVGRNYICYGLLIHGNTSVLFEDKLVGTPDAVPVWKAIFEHNVRSFFTGPTAFSAIKREDPDGKYKEKYNPIRLNMLYLTGERANLDTIH